MVKFTSVATCLLRKHVSYCFRKLHLILRHIKCYIVANKIFKYLAKIKLLYDLERGYVTNKKFIVNPRSAQPEQHQILLRHRPSCCRPDRFPILNTIAENINQVNEKHLRSHNKLYFCHTRPYLVVPA